MADQVNVSNELPKKSGAERSDAFRTKLIPLDREGAETVILPHSPRGHEEAVSPNWSTRGAVGVRTDGRDWEQSAPKRLSLNTQLQASHGGRSGPSPAELWSMLGTLETWATAPTNTTGEPTRVTLQQGMESMTGTIDEMTKNVTEKTPDGLPKTVELSMTIVEA